MTTGTYGDVRVAWDAIEGFAERTGRAEVLFRPPAPWPAGGGRRAGMRTWGQAVYLVEDEPAGWRDELEPLLEILRDPPATVDLAFIRRTPGWPGSWTALGSVGPGCPTRASQT